MVEEFKNYLKVELVKLRKASLLNLLFRFVIYDLPFPLVDGVNIINYSTGSVIGEAREIVGNNVSLYQRSGSESEAINRPNGKNECARATCVV